MPPRPLATGNAAGSRRPRRVAVAASLVVHAGALAWLAWNARTPAAPEPPTPPVFEVALLPERAASAGRPRPGAAPSPPAQPPASASPRAAASSAPTTVPPPPPAEPAVRAEALPAPAQPGGAAPVQPASPGAGAGQVGGGGLAGDDLRGLLRGLTGCGDPQGVGLTAGERARCAERLRVAALTAPKIDPIPAEKRAYYDAVAAAYATVRSGGGNPGRAFAGAPRPQLLTDAGGLYIPLPACHMPFGIPRGWKSYHDAPPHSLKLAKLGRLTCFIQPPQSLGTEESAVQAPASLRERREDAAHMTALDPPK